MFWHDVQYGSAWSPALTKVTNPYAAGRAAKPSPGTSATPQPKGDAEKADGDNEAEAKGAEEKGSKVKYQNVMT